MQSVRSFEKESEGKKCRKELGLFVQVFISRVGL